jgi:hypothetical protein
MATGWYYKCTTAGRTSSARPAKFPRIDAATFRDGSAVFETVHPDDETVPEVDTAVWTVPSGLTKDLQTEDRFATNITLSGGTDGEDYEVTCRMTPTSGDALDQTIVIPVRSQ